MKKFLFVVFISSGLHLFSQDCKVSSGTKTLYKAYQSSYTKPPVGYQPVFINYVGRHGARHLTKDLANTTAYKYLIKADSLNALTGEGERLRKMVLLLRTVEAKELKSISQVGKNELEAIAHRLVQNNENIFKEKDFRLSVAVTKEIRTEQSADAFLKGLGTAMNGRDVKKTVDDTALRFYDLSPAYRQFEEDGQWTKAEQELESALNSKSAFEKFSTRFFKASFQMPAKDMEEFSRDIYGFAVIVPSITFEITQQGKKLTDLDFRSFFTCRQLTVMSRLDEAEDFLLKGPGEDSLGLQVKIAAPLLVQFLSSSDELLNDASPALQLRFAHAETIAPFAALMQISSASRPVTKIENFDQSWKAGEIVPLSSNIQWIFYKAQGKSGYFVKFLLNEKEVEIKGLKAASFPFYNWNDVKKFYADILSRLDVKPGANMKDYLLNLH